MSPVKWTDVHRVELCRIYKRLIGRFGADHVIRRLRGDLLKRAAHRRVERAA